jgi:hypothetical protein
MRPTQHRQKLATEMKFTPERDPVTKEWVPTMREVPDEVAADPWITKYFADGCIEKPEQTAARLQKTNAQKQQEIDAAQRIIDQAEAAFKRATATADTTQVRNEDLDQALNTPVNELRIQHGAGIDPPKDEAAKKAKAK